MSGSIFFDVKLTGKVYPVNHEKLHEAVVLLSEDFPLLMRPSNYLQLADSAGKHLVLLSEIMNEEHSSRLIPGYTVFGMDDSGNPDLSIVGYLGMHSEEITALSSHAKLEFCRKLLVNALVHEKVIFAGGLNSVLKWTGSNLYCYWKRKNREPGLPVY